MYEFMFYLTGVLCFVVVAEFILLLCGLHIVSKRINNLCSQSKRLLKWYKNN